MERKSRRAFLAGLAALSGVAGLAAGCGESRVGVTEVEDRKAVGLSIPVRRRRRPVMPGAETTPPTAPDSP